MHPKHMTDTELNLFLEKQEYSSGIADEQNAALEEFIRRQEFIQSTK